MRRRLLALAVVLACGRVVMAWNPLALSAGFPARWDTGGPVVWNPDGGDLGKLTNGQAITMVTDEFAKWETVGTAVITFAEGAQIVDPSTGLPTDVTAANYSDVVNASNGQNPIIFDNQREIFDSLGIPSGVVGFAAPVRLSGTSIVKAIAVLQGDWFDDEPAGTAPSDPGETTEGRFRGVMVHEFGHFINLAHSSVNHELTGTGLPGCSAPTVFQLETMGPFLHSDTLTLHHDDIVGVSHLYPTAAFQNDFAGLQGQLIDRDGSTPFAGANMVLRPATADCDLLYDTAQAMQSGASPEESGGAGSFAYQGLVPGGGYTILATTIQDGAGYPIPPPSSLGGPDDFYNGLDEDWFDPPDDPTVAEVVTTGAGGTTLGGLDVKINNAGNPGEVPAGDGSAGGPGLQVDDLSGGSQPPEDLALDDGEVDSAMGFEGTDRAVWVNRFTLNTSQTPFTLERLDLLFWDNSVAAGRDIRLLVYVDPAATGNPANASLVYTEDVTVQFLSLTNFNEYTLAAPVLVEGGEFYVGAMDLVADGETTFIASFDEDTASGRAYLQANSTSPSSFGLVPDLTWMVRARGRAGAPEGTILLTWDAACNTGTVPDQDYAVYEGSLASLRDIPDHVPITCSTARETFFTVLGAGDNRFWLVAPILATREGSLGVGTGMSPRTPATTCAPIIADACP